MQLRLCLQLLYIDYLSKLEFVRTRLRLCSSLARLSQGLQLHRRGHRRRVIFKMLPVILENAIFIMHAPGLRYVQ